MNKVLDQKVRAYNIAFSERLAGLKTEEKQQFIEGAVFALDALFRYGNLKDLTPVSREMFIGSVLANSYSAAFHQNLNSDKHMKGLVESHNMQAAEAFVGAAKIQLDAGVPLTFDEEMQVKQMAMMV